ncbi:MAG: flippase [Candidatus Omnitrophota bacterium]
MGTAKSMLKNAVFLLVATVVANVLNLISLIYLARVLGPTGFGEVNFAFAIIAYFMLLTDMGLPLVGIREIARDKTQTKKLVSHIIVLRFILTFISSCLLGVLLIFIRQPQEVKYLLLIYGLGMVPSAFLVDWVFQGVERMEFICIARIMSGIVNLGLVLTFVKSSGQLLLIPSFQVASNLLMSLLLSVFFIKVFGTVNIKFDRKIKIWEILKQAFPIGFSLLMAQIFYYISTVMIGFMRGNEEVGYYNAAYKVIFLFIVVIGVYHDAIFPTISFYSRNSLERLKNLLSVTQRLMIILALPLATGCIVLARPLMHILYGTKYDEGIGAFKILIFAVVIIYINTAYSRGLLAAKKEKWFAAGVTLPAFVSILSNFILIPRLGLQGAAIANVFSEASGFVVMYVGFRKIMHVPFLSYISRPLFASLIMFMFLHCGLNLYHWNFFLLTGAGIILYCAVLYLIRGVTKEDFTLIKKIFFAPG